MRARWTNNRTAEGNTFDRGTWTKHLKQSCQLIKSQQSCWPQQACATNAWQGCGSSVRWSRHICNPDAMQCNAIRFSGPEPVSHVLCSFRHTACPVCSLIRLSALLAQPEVWLCVLPCRSAQHVTYKAVTTCFRHIEPAVSKSTTARYLKWGTAALVLFKGLLEGRHP